jgi:hypothetical protein
MLAVASADRHSGRKSSQRGKRRVAPVAHVARPSTAEGPVPLNAILLPAILKFVFRLPLHLTRLDDHQMWRWAAAGPVAFDRLHQ